MIHAENAVMRRQPLDPRTLFWILPFASEVTQATSPRERYQRLTSSNAVVRDVDVVARPRVLNAWLGDGGRRDVRRGARQPARALEYRRERHDGAGGGGR